MNELIQFSLDTENGEKNYKLAQWYESQDHTAPAHSYYLRAAERSADKLLVYKSLLRASFCYKSQGSREGTEKVLLENALNFLPERPEAYYFLSLLYERNQEWQNSYTYANLGLQCYKQEVNELNFKEYEGKYLLIFQKAVAAWWWGKGQECRELFWSLVDHYWDLMDNNHKQSVENNITRLGSGPESQAFVPYTSADYDRLKFKFAGADKIQQNYSQVYQDMFILAALKGKRNGTFLEIGGADPYKGNNTTLLEKAFDWKGVSIEYDDNFIENYRQHRTANLIHGDALLINYKKLFQENFNGNIIDYLQLDIEPAKNTYECMLRIPFDDYKFGVITYEHDYYVDVTKSFREKSRQFLTSKGYILVVNDISPDGSSNFEDWWVHPDLVDFNNVQKMRSIKNETHNIRDYMLLH